MALRLGCLTFIQVVLAHPAHSGTIRALNASNFNQYAVLDTRSGGGIRFEAIIMKESIQPKYNDITATCSCGNVIQTRSTLSKDITIEVCSECHPFYTGKQKVVDTGGRIDRFNKRFAARRGN